MLSNLNNTPSSPCLKTRTHSASNITSNFNEANSFKISPRFALFANRFNSKNEEGKFLGETSDQRDSEQYCQFIQTRTRARAYFTFEGDGLLIQKKAIQSLEPTPEATQRTKDAVSDFFSSAYNILERNNKKFPLAGKNKCLGMVAVPGKKLAILAISQDKNPDNDRALRSEMLTLLESMNQEQGNAWIFELASIPTKSQYMMPRTLFMRTTLPAISSWVSPRTQCV